MGKIIIDCGISLDGFFAGENGSPQNPMGNAQAIHQWMFKQKAFWTHLNMEGGEEYGPESKLIEAVFERTGAYIMGKRMFDEGEVHWPENLYKKDVFVLTHQVREPWIQAGSTRFFLINDGIHSALEKARASAQGKDIRIQGGAEAIQAYLRAGLVDEMFIHTAPLFIGKGIRLFDGMVKDLYHIEIMETIPSNLSTHTRYQLTRK